LNAHLANKGITLRSGPLVDVSRRTRSVRVRLRKIIDAPSSTRNKSGVCDPGMSSAKKGNDRYFGMKAHIGVDADSGVTHSLETSTAKLHDGRVRDALLHGEETSVWAELPLERHWSGRQWRRLCQRRARGSVRGAGQGLGRSARLTTPRIVCLTLEPRKAPKGGKLHPLDERANRIVAMVRARVEHPFRVIKRQFGHVKTRYHGLAKNRARIFTLFALGNLFLVRRRLTA